MDQRISLFGSMSWPRRIMLVLGCLCIVTWTAITVTLLVRHSQTSCWGDVGRIERCPEKERTVSFWIVGTGVVLAFPGLFLIVPGALSFSRARHRARLPSG